MTQQELEALIDGQLAADLGLEPSVWAVPGRVTVVPWWEVPGRRRYRREHPFFLGYIRRGAAAFAVHDCLLPWAQAHLAELEPEWCLDYPFLRQMDDALRPWGWTIHNAHPFFAPDLTAPPAKAEFSATWYERDALEPFRGDPRWGDALAFQPDSPDMLAVAALDGDGGPIAMAGASRDGARLWQIGVNVLPPRRGRGLAAALTAQLKDELLRRGTVPFYGTAQSHVFSQNTAWNAGFRPSWAEVWAKPL